MIPSFKKSKTPRGLRGVIFVLLTGNLVMAAVAAVLRVQS